MNKEDELLREIETLKSLLAQSYIEADQMKSLVLMFKDALNTIRYECKNLCESLDNHTIT